MHPEYENGFPSMFRLFTDKRDFIFMNHVATKQTKIPQAENILFGLFLKKKKKKKETENNKQTISFQIFCNPYIIHVTPLN